MTIVYGVPLSPYCRKLQLAFAYRGIDYDLVLTPPGSDDPEFAEASPFGKVPAVCTNLGHVFADSSVIVAYYEKIQPGRPLYPEDPGDFANALFLEEFADTRLSEATSALYFQKVLSPVIYGKAPDAGRVAELQTEAVPRQLSALETLSDADQYPRVAAFSNSFLEREDVQRQLAAERKALQSFAAKGG